MPAALTALSTLSVRYSRLSSTISHNMALTPLGQTLYNVTIALLILPTVTVLLRFGARLKQSLKGQRPMSRTMLVLSDVFIVVALVLYIAFCTLTFIGQYTWSDHKLGSIMVSDWRQLCRILWEASSF